MNRGIDLGSLIIKCKELDEKLPVYYDTGQHPTDIDSWRGIYAELAISHEVDGEPMTCGEFIEMLEVVDGKEFTGYKGGEFTMRLRTPVWMDNYGQYSNMMITDVKQYSDSRIIIVTEYGDA